MNPKHLRNDETVRKARYREDVEEFKRRCAGKARAWDEGQAALRRDIFVYGGKHTPNPYREGECQTTA
jgi:hypothetical protein